jgi:hypothetical protein
MAKKTKIDTKLQPETQVNYPPGTYVSGNINLKAADSSVTGSCTRNNWATVTGDIASLTVDISLDGGTTWQLLVGFTAAGGDPIDPATGLPATTSSVTTSLPQVGNTKRVLKGTLQVFSQLTTTVSYSVS